MSDSLARDADASAHLQTRLLEPRIAAGLTAVVALVATGGSLYFSEVLGLTPCELCWFQRIFMYPLVVVFGLGALLETDVRPIGLALAIPGAVVAAYHSYIQAFGPDTCTLDGGCTSVQYELLGLSIPNMALVAFVLIALVAGGSLVATRAQP